MDQQQQPPQDLQAQLTALLTQAQQQPAQSAAAPQGWTGGWQQPQLAMAPTGLAVPLSIETPAGKVRVYLQYPAQAAATPQAIMALLESLAAQNYPLDIWRGQSAWGGSNRGGGSWRR
jgi:hypothetical protein